MRRHCLESLEAFLAQGGRKIDAWYASLKVVEVSFDDEADAFRNINTREELETYDPELFHLIDETFGKNPWRYVRYERRNAPRKEPPPAETR